MPCIGFFQLEEAYIKEPIVYYSLSYFFILYFILCARTLQMNFWVAQAFRYKKVFRMLSDMCNLYSTVYQNI